jgi:hypothetical protein
MLVLAYGQDFRGEKPLHYQFLPFTYYCGKGRSLFIFRASSEIFLKILRIHLPSGLE